MSNQSATATALAAATLSGCAGVVVGGAVVGSMVVIDRDQNAVACNFTLNELFGCGLWIGEVGQFLNNEMDDFTTAPGRPNAFGIVQGEANRVAAGRRMLSSMSPTLALRGDEALPLTSGEFELLSCFVYRPSRILSRDQLIDWTRGRAAGATTAARPTIRQRTARARTSPSTGAPRG